MVQIICGSRGKGKTKFLLEKANEVIRSAEGSVVFLDKNSKHLHELNIKIRLINVSEFPVKSADGFIGFVAGIASQDHDLEYMFLDSFLRLSCLEEDDSAMEYVIGELEKLSSKFGVKFILSVSRDENELPESQKGNVIISL